MSTHSLKVLWQILEGLVISKRLEDFPLVEKSIDLENKQTGFQTSEN